MHKGMRLFACTLASTSLVLPLVSWSAGGGSMGGGMSPSPSIEPAAPPTPEQVARSAYNNGVHTVNKAKSADSDAAKARDEAKKQKLLDKALKGYHSALEQFTRAVASDDSLFQAWNYIGFCQRHLGDYQAALNAYARALALNPAYSEAVEYRGEAYLGLNRTEDAKAAYMQLFRDVRPLADELMTAMRRWVDQRHVDPQGMSADELAAFSSWVSERATVAQQTASLAGDGIARPQADWK